MPNRAPHRVLQRHLLFLGVIHNDWDKPAPGRPFVPVAWDKFVLNKPVQGTVTEVLGREEAWLSLGTADGILPGMVLVAQRHGNVTSTWVRVNVVEKGRSRVKCENEGGEKPRLAVGQPVTSRFRE